MIQHIIHTFRLAGLGAVLDVTEPCVVLADEVPGLGRATTTYSGRVVLALDGGTSDGGQIGASFGYKYKTIGTLVANSTVKDVTLRQVKRLRLLYIFIGIEEIWLIMLRHYYD